MHLQARKLTAISACHRENHHKHFQIIKNRRKHILLIKQIIHTASTNACIAGIGFSASA